MPLGDLENTNVFRTWRVLMHLGLGSDLNLVFELGFQLNLSLV